MRSRLLFLTLAVLLCANTACSQAPEIAARAVDEFPHRAATFTEGLIIVDGEMYESSGGWGRSEVLRVDRKTGAVLKRAPLPDDRFAEGISLVGDTLYLLTWKSGEVYLLDRATFQTTSMARCLDASGDIDQGWGLAWDGERLYRSNGTGFITIHDPTGFRRIGGFEVNDHGRTVTRLNELEWVDGWLLANVWKEDRVAVIDPKSGAVRVWLDLAPLRASLGRGAGVANGIAWDAETHRLYVTGKYWDKLFEIETGPLFELLRTAAPEQP